MDQRAINEAVRQAVRRCLDSRDPGAALCAFLRRLRAANWSDEAIGSVDNAAHRMIAIIFEPDSAESAMDVPFEQLVASIPFEELVASAGCPESNAAQES